MPGLKAECKEPGKQAGIQGEDNIERGQEGMRVLAIRTLLSPLSLPGMALLPDGYFSPVCLAHPNASPFTGLHLFAPCSHAHTGASYRGSTCGINFLCSILYPCLFAYAVLSYALEVSLPFQAKKDKGQAGVGEEEGRYQVRILPGAKKKKVTFV